MNEEKFCCPKFDPTLWDGKTVEWNNKKFIKDKVYTFFYMPLNFGSVMTRSIKKIEDAGTKLLDGMALSEHTSMWNMNVYLAVDQEISEAENVSISGKFLSKVYEGNFSETGKWTADFSDFAKGQNMEIQKNYLWYTTCPKCAKKYGKNYVVIMGEI